MILGATVTMFVLGRVRSDIVALGALLALMVTGVLSPQEALSGFSNSIIMTLAGVFVVGGAIVRSGLANSASRRILKLAGTNQHALFMSIMLLTAGVGSLVSNTGTIAIMMPVVVSLARAINASPSRFLMPLAFMSSIGGMLTLIGNPANMVVNDAYVKAGFPALTLFSFAPVGVVCLAFGLVILAPATSFFLSRRRNQKGDLKDKDGTLEELADKYHLASSVQILSVPPGNPLAGQTLEHLQLGRDFGVLVQEIRREEHRHFGHHAIRQIAPGPQTAIQPGDVLFVLGAPEQVRALAETWGLRDEPGRHPGTEDGYRFQSLGLCELVLMASSRLVNRTVAESGLREQYGISLLGIQRGDRYILENVKDVVMQPGDALLVQGSWENIARLDEQSRHWVVVGSPEHRVKPVSPGKAGYVAVILALMVGAMATGLLPTVAAVIAAALLMLAGGCFNNVEEAYGAINWETLVMIACMLPMAIAMEKTGMVGLAANAITEAGRQHGPLAALGLIYGVTSALNIVISGTPVALLIAPVGVQVALDLGYQPLPFLFAVATASCMCFASPFSTPANALVMSAGRYTFADYLKIGLPLQVLMGAVMVPALAWLFPF